MLVGVIFPPSWCQGWGGQGNAACQHLRRAPAALQEPGPCCFVSLQEQGWRLASNCTKKKARKPTLNCQHSFDAGGEVL